MKAEAKAFIEAYARPFYEAPGRYYHNWFHVLTMLLRASDDSPEVYLATIFHDIVYDSKSTTNEADSVKEFEKFWEMYGELVTDYGSTWIPDKQGVFSQVRSRMQHIDVARVKYFILATRKHDFTHDIQLNGFLLADLAVLYGHPDAYWAYAMGIRREYAHVPPREYIEGRTKVLGDLRKRLPQGLPSFHIEKLYTNIDRELEKLPLLATLT